MDSGQLKISIKNVQNKIFVLMKLHKKFGAIL